MLPENVAIPDHQRRSPFALRRWRAAEGIDRVQLLSDYQEHSFAVAYGVLIDELKLLARAIFVVGADNKILYREIVPEVNQHPDYDAALNAAPASRRRVGPLQAPRAEAKQARCGGRILPPSTRRGAHLAWIATIRACRGASR